MESIHAQIRPSAGVTDRPGHSSASGRSHRVTDISTCQSEGPEGHERKAGPKMDRGGEGERTPWGKVQLGVGGAREWARSAVGDSVR